MHRILLPLALLAAQPAAADPFTLFIHEAPASLALRTAPGETGGAYWESWAAFGTSAQEAGVLRGGSALDAAQVQVVPAATPAPAMALSGYFQLDVPDMAAALSWAAKLPLLPGDAVTVQAGYKVPGM